MVDACEIPFHCADREQELVGDFAVGVFLGDELQDLEFPLAEGFAQNFADLRCLPG